jgi:hypothetical protein
MTVRRVMRTDRHDRRERRLTIANRLNVARGRDTNASKGACMDDKGNGVSRRGFLRASLAAGAATTAVVAAGAVATAGGCASLPRIAKQTQGGHPCDHAHCRYHRAGRCGLALRDEAGWP